jgi:hypothetical protein
LAHEQCDCEEVGDGGPGDTIKDDTRVWHQKYLDFLVIYVLTLWRLWGFVDKLTPKTEWF